MGKKAVILFFPISKMESIEVGPFEFHDKIPLKSNYKEKGVRVVPMQFQDMGLSLKKVLF